MSYILNQFYHSGEQEKTWLASLANLKIHTSLLFSKKGSENDITEDTNLTYQNSFKNICFYLGQSAQENSATFIADKTYYCRFLIEKDIVQSGTNPYYTQEDYQEFVIKLVNVIGDDNAKIVDKSKNEQYIKTISVYNRLESDSRWQYVDFTFTPQNSNFNAIFFHMSRATEDFYNERIPRIVLLEASEVINIIGASDANVAASTESTLLKMGIQSAPGLRMIINHEEIYVGRTGVYEIKNKNIKVGNISFIAPVKYYENINNILNNIDSTKNLDAFSTINENNYFYFTKNKTLGVNNITYITNGQTIVNFYNLYQQVPSKRKFQSFTLDYIYDDNDE